MLREALTIAIVLAAYAVMSIPAITERHRFLRRPYVALAGGALLVALGLVAWRAAWSAIDARTLALLTGMMLLVAALEQANAFGVIASRLVRALPTPGALLAGTMGVVAVLSALVLNDAVVLLFTPILIKAARSMGVPAFPFLCAEALAANLGSVATPTGNPQNAVIALAHSFTFVAFARALAPLALVCVLLGVIYCVFVFRRDLRKPEHRASVPIERFTSAPAIWTSGACVALALALFFVGPSWGIQIWAAALASGALALVLSFALAPRRGVAVARHVDVSILLFFVGLFVLLEGVRASGAAATIDAALARSGSGGATIATAVLSNVVSNVPAVLLLLPGVREPGQALLLAATSTLAGNATFFGSAATVIVAETARSRGESFSVVRFTLVGFPLAVLTLFIAWLWLG